MLTSLNQFQERMSEVDCLIELMPQKPSSETANMTNSLCRAAVVLLCSHLEGFLQDLMEEFIEEVNQLSIGFKILPTELFLQHTFPKGKINSNTFDSILSFSNEFRLLENSNIAVKLNKKNFSKTDSNPTPDVINKLFKIIGENDILDTLNLEILDLPTKEIKTPFLTEDEKKEITKAIGLPSIIDYIDEFLTNKRNSSGRKDRNVGFYNVINNLLDYRNQIAHGNQGFTISAIKLVELKDNLLILVTALTEKASLKIEQLKEKKQIPEPIQ